MIANPTSRKVFLGLQVLIAICILYSTILNSIETEKTSGQNAPHVPLYGVYNTAYFIRNNDTIPPLETDSLRWKQLVIDDSSWNQSGIIQFSTGMKIFYNVQADTVKRILRIQSRTDTAENYFLNYFEPDSNHILLKGIWKKDSIKVLMSKYDLNNYLLHREKFKWIED